MKTDLTTIEFEIQPSRYLLLFFIILHIIAVFAVLNTNLSGVFQVVIFLLVTLHFFVSLKYGALQQRPRKLIYTENRGWRLETEQSADPIEILPSTLITTFLVIVHYRKSSSSLFLNSLVCFKDALGAKDFKKLIVQLKIFGCKKI